MKLLSTLLLLPFLAPVAQAQEEALADAQEPIVIDATLIIINDSILTTSMLEREVNRMLGNNPDLSPMQANTFALTGGVRKMLFEETFQQLGFDEGLLDPQIELRIEQMILEDGSRASLEESLRKDGYGSIEEFRQDLRNSFVQNTVSGVLGGQIPTPNQGMRILAKPTPKEIREAYEEFEHFRHVPSSMEWSRLTFFEERGKEAPEVRAAAVIQGLEDGTLTVEEALAMADRTFPSTVIGESLTAEIRAFLQTGAPGATMDITREGSNRSNVLLVVGRTEEQHFTFEESQILIEKELTAANREKAVMDALGQLYRSSYVWVNPEVQGLEESLERTFGGGNDSLESEEL